MAQYFTTPWLSASSGSTITSYCVAEEEKWLQRASHKPVKLFQSTYTSLAFRLARTSGSTEANGSRDSAPDYLNVMTRGKSNDESNTQITTSRLERLWPFKEGHQRSNALLDAELPWSQPLPVLVAALRRLPELLVLPEQWRQGRAVVSCQLLAGLSFPSQHHLLLVVVR
ncbi:hypothetical protein RRG08_011104 [Elysia crispata]|uniref:Uncharacterized protein n=1 Tax=Elysia crispata TaxID=231223 RepID=A0AAE1A0I9_9GAST|nr:hypothetical protein RRG08_011104 [Elysia crispata]